MVLGLVLGQNSLREKIKSIQTGVINIPHRSYTNTDTINSVDVSNCILLYLGQRALSDYWSGWDCISAYLTLTNSTTITATRDGIDLEEDPSNIDISYSILEFYPGIIKSIQSGTITIPSASTTHTATISAVNTGKTLISFLGLSPTPGSGGNVVTQSSNLASLTLTNSTTITATRTASSASTIVSYQVIEFN